MTMRLQGADPAGEALAPAYAHRPGSRFQPGASVDAEGVNFCIFSRYARRVELLLYAAATQLPATFARRRLAFAGVCAGLCLTIAGSVVGAARDEQARRAKYRIVNPLTPPQSMQEEGAGPASPFFPSSADTNVRGIIPATFFMTSESCGRCHQELYEQWQSSMHHFSSFNNQWYRKSIEYMQEVVGTKP